MGRGNVCVTGECEGLYYLSYDDTHWYRKENDDGTVEECLLRDLDFQDMCSCDWKYCDILSEYEEEQILQDFMDAFVQRFPSFLKEEEDLKHYVVLSNGAQAIMENNLFWVAIKDNQWSLAIELIQKEDPYDNHLIGLQKRHFQKYLDEIRNILLDIVPEIYGYSGAWTSQRITRNDSVEQG